MKKKTTEEIWNAFDNEIELCELNNHYDYFPLTNEEYFFLEKELKQITSYMPNHLMTQFWNFKNRIDGTNEIQPCSCKSSGHHWKKCIETLRSYVNNFNK